MVNENRAGGEEDASALGVGYGEWFVFQLGERTGQNVPAADG